MSLLQRTVVLDADVISNFHTAGQLGWLLTSGEGKFVVAAEVLREIEQWPTEGKRAKQILDDAIRDGKVSAVYLEPPEFGLYRALRARLGSGEAASIAVATHRGYAVGTDDRAARKLCGRQNPLVEVHRTEDFLELAIANGDLRRDEARQIWKRMNIRDPERGIRE